MLESPRYLLQKGHVEKAKNILARVASWNKYQLPPGQLITQDEKERIIAEGKHQPDVSVAYSIQSVEHSVEDDVKHQVSYGTVSSQDNVGATVCGDPSERTPLVSPAKSLVCI